MSPLSPAPGIRIGGRYALTRRIAGGGMGDVWAATDVVLGREVAVKLLRGEHADDPAFLARFRAEARHAASLTHPGIAGVYDYGEDDGVAYIVMELVAGEPLSARLQRDGRLPPAIAVALLSQTAQALQAAHAAGLVHRDVKPANLMITPEQQVKVTDFGIARLDSSEPVTRTGEVMGTAQYLSPEQATGRQAGPASDVYSLGVVGYEMLAGRRPFEADNPVAVAMAHVSAEPDPLPADVPPAIGAVITQAMAKDPASRPASAAAFAAALTGALGQSAAARTGSDDATVPLSTRTGALAGAAGADATQVMGTTARVAAVPAPEPAAAAAAAPVRSRLGGRILLALLLVALLAVGGAVLSQRLGGAAPTPPLPSVTPALPTSPSAPAVAPTSETTTSAPPTTDTSTTGTTSDTSTSDTSSSTDSSTSRTTTSDTSTSDTSSSSDSSTSDTTSTTRSRSSSASRTSSTSTQPSTTSDTTSSTAAGPTTGKPSKTKPPGKPTKPTKPTRSPTRGGRR